MALFLGGIGLFLAGFTVSHVMARVLVQELLRQHGR